MSAIFAASTAAIPCFVTFNIFIMRETSKFDKKKIKKNNNPSGLAAVAILSVTLLCELFSAYFNTFQHCAMIFNIFCLETLYYMLGLIKKHCYTLELILIVFFFLHVNNVLRKNLKFRRFHEWYASNYVF